VDAVIKAYRDETTPGMRANREIPISELARRIWEKNGFTLVLSEELPQPQKGKLQHHFRLTREEYSNNIY
jgi:hypothetical protein